MNTQPNSMEKDPVCGMTVDPALAKAMYEHAGKTYYFCCPGCQVKFSGDPAKYLQAKPASVSAGLQHEPAPDPLMGIAPASSKPLPLTPRPARLPHAAIASHAPP